MKKLNITKEQFNRSNYFQKKYGKLEYVSESGRLFKTSKGKVLKFNEGFMSNMGKDGQHLYSIIYKFDGWDGSVQEYGKSEEDAIQNAIAKGKIDDEDEIVKVVDLGEKGEYLESSRKLAKEAGRKVIPAANGCSIHDMGDCWIVTNKNGLNIGQCRTLIEAEDIAENADEYTARKLGYSESKKIVKEGAGAGYTVTIKDLKLGSILEKKYVKMKKDYESYWECQVEVMPGEYEIEASDYYNDFFWQEHEFGDTPTAKIDGGIATISYSTNSYDEDEAEDELRREVARRTMDVSFDYGWGWTHADLPREKIEADHVDASGEFYGSIDKLELNAPDLADAVNSGYQSTFDQGEEDAEEDEDGEPVNEVSGWKLEDEDLTLVNTESDGDKLYIVKLWWGSGYQMDCYNAYAFNEEEALNYVVAYIEKTDPESLEAVDEAARSYLEDIVNDGDAADTMEAEESPYFQESFLYVDATTEGAKNPHYIWAENLQIAEYPKEHDYPMSKGARHMNESYDPNGDDGRKKVMAALEEFRQVLWDDTKVDDEEEHDLRRSLFQDVDNAISQAVQKYFKYSRM